MYLNKNEILKLLHTSTPIITNLTDESVQVTPNGVDLCIGSVQAFDGLGRVHRGQTKTELPHMHTIQPQDGAYYLHQGIYLAQFIELVHIPTNVVAHVAPRSSLARSGVTLGAGFWDSGYSGASSVMLNVLNPRGFYIELGARFVQMMFSYTTGDALQDNQTYNGQYQHSQAIHHWDDNKPHKTPIVAPGPPQQN